MTATRPFVAVVDDDESVRESLPDLLRELGYAAATFSSAEEYLASTTPARFDCLLLDIALSGMSGPDLQHELRQRDDRTPIIFITAHGNDSIRSKLIEGGAVECLFKPFSDTALRRALDAAIGAA